MILGDMLAVMTERGFNLKRIQEAIERPLLKNFVAGRRSIYDIAEYSFKIKRQRWDRAEQILPLIAVKRGYPDCVTAYALVWNCPEVYAWADQVLADAEVPEDSRTVWQSHMYRYKLDKEEHSKHPEHHAPWDVEWVPED